MCKYLCRSSTADLSTSLFVSPTRRCDLYTEGVLAASLQSHSGCIVMSSGLVQRLFTSVRRQSQSGLCIKDRDREQESIVCSASGISSRWRISCFILAISTCSKHGVWPSHGRDPQAKYKRTQASDSTSSRLPSSHPRWLLTALNAGLPNEPQHSWKALWRCVEGSLYSLAILKSMR